jgi:pyruvate formate lyase activating enzyme
MSKISMSSRVSTPDRAGQAGQECLNREENGTGAPQSGRRGEGLTGTVINIQRFSTHDGPGVRTTVFLKGCTNTCAWCHNPESMRPRPEVQLYPDRCIGCGRCLVVCPEGAHEVVAGEKVYHRQRCKACGRCIDECFAGGLVLAGRTRGVEEVMAEILQDEPYYRHSGGGVTFSGGEPVMQHEFLLALLQRCREEGLHTAVETAGNYPWEWLARLLPFLDLVMYDLKVMDPARHRQYVGNDGERTRANLLQLAGKDVPLIVRTPVIGGVNDTPAEIGAIARFIQPFPGLRYYELLPYHQLGESKRHSLGLPAEDRFYTPSKETIADLAATARLSVREVRP